jgi:cytochrome d ubiquinol oxidase subunit I
VKGIKALQAEYEGRYGPGHYWPPVKWSYWTFRGMVGAGAVMFLLAAWATLTASRARGDASRLLLRALVPAIALPYIANSTGWIFTEIGRQPWIVFGLQKTEAAVSPAVSTGELLVTLVGFTAIYGVLMAADIYLLNKFAKAGLPVGSPDVPAVAIEPVRA